MSVNMLYLKLFLFTIIQCLNAHYISGINNKADSRSHSIEHFHEAHETKDRDEYQSVDSDYVNSYDDDDTEDLRRYLKDTILHKLLLNKTLDKLEAAEEPEIRSKDHWKQRPIYYSNVKNDYDESESDRSNSAVDEINQAETFEKSKPISLDDHSDNTPEIDYVFIENPNEIIVPYKQWKPVNKHLNINEISLGDMTNTIIEQKSEDSVSDYGLDMDNDELNEPKHYTSSKILWIPRHHYKNKLIPEKEEITSINEFEPSREDSNDSDMDYVIDGNDFQLDVNRILDDRYEYYEESDADKKIKYNWLKLVAMLKDKNLKPRERDFIIRLLETMKKSKLRNPVHLASYLKTVEDGPIHLNDYKGIELVPDDDKRNTLNIGRNKKVQVPDEIPHDELSETPISKKRHHDDETTDEIPFLSKDFTLEIQNNHTSIWPGISKPIIQSNHVDMRNNMEMEGNPNSGVKTADHKKKFDNEFVNTLTNPNGLIKIICEAVEQNVDDFWKIFYSYFSKQPREKLQNLEKLYLILTIFTQLNKAKQLGLPIEEYVDKIVEIIQPDVHLLDSIAEINDIPGPIDQKPACVKCYPEKIKDVTNNLNKNNLLLSDETPSLENTNVVPSNLNEIPPKENDPTKIDLHENKDDAKDLVIEPENSKDLLSDRPEETFKPDVTITDSEMKPIDSEPGIINVEAKTVNPALDINYPESITVKSIPENFHRETINVTPGISEINVVKLVPDKMNPGTKSFDPIPGEFFPKTKVGEFQADITYPEVKPVVDNNHSEASIIKIIQNVKYPEKINNESYISNQEMKIIRSQSSTIYPDLIAMPDSTYNAKPVKTMFDNIHIKGVEPVTDPKNKIVKPSPDIIYLPLKPAHPLPNKVNSEAYIVKPSGLTYSHAKPVKHPKEDTPKYYTLAQPAQTILTNVPEQSTEMDFYIDPEDANIHLNTPMNLMMGTSKDVISTDTSFDLYGSSEKLREDNRPKKPQVLLDKPFFYPEIKYTPEVVYPETIKSVDSIGPSEKMIGELSEVKTIKPGPFMVPVGTETSKPVENISHPQEETTAPIIYYVVSPNEDIDRSKLNHTARAKLLSLEKYNPTINTTNTLKHRHPTSELLNGMGHSGRQIKLDRVQLNIKNKYNEHLESDIPKGNDYITKDSAPSFKYLNELFGENFNLTKTFDLPEKENQLPETNNSNHIVLKDFNWVKNKEFNIPYEHPNYEINTKLMPQKSVWKIILPWQEIYSFLQSSEIPDKDIKIQELEDEPSYSILDYDEYNIKILTETTKPPNNTNDALQVILTRTYFYLKSVLRDLGFHILRNDRNIYIIFNILKKILLLLIKFLTANGLSLRQIINILMDLQHKLRLFETPTLRNCVTKVYDSLIQITKSVMKNFMDSQ